MLCNPLISTIRRAYWKQYLLVVIGVALLAGCSSAPKLVVPVPLNVFIHADKKINPDNYGRPSPLKVVFYELKSSVAFETADFFSLSQRDQATLGAELLGKEEFFLRPGETIKVSRKGFPDTGALGIFVEFRDIDKSIWHATAPVSSAEIAGMFAVFKGSNQKNYQVEIDQQSVKFVPVTITDVIFEAGKSKIKESIPKIPMPTIPTFPH